MVKTKQTSGKNRKKVFISYANADRNIARDITKELVKQGLNVWFDQFELKSSNAIKEKIDSAIFTSDYLIILLSSTSVNSAWVQQELNSALIREIYARDITIIPILLEDCEIPQRLKSRIYLDFRTNYEHGIKQLIKQIGLFPDIDFSKLNSKTFELLVIDLLQTLGFSEIEQEYRIQNKTIDIKANHTSIDPFGKQISETWLVETKLYRESRADLSSIHQLASYLLTLPENFKGVLITNGQITSAARHWLETVENKKRIDLRVLDGTDLKRLLLNNKELVNKYFLSSGEAN